MLVGVTGQIGSGKSAVCAELVRLGARLIDADEVGKRVTGSPAVLKLLAKRFGKQIQTKSGKLRPAVLGELVFSDSSGAALEYLNRVVQPRLTVALKRDIKRLNRSDPKSPIVLDAAILPQWDLINACDLVITVVATRAVRLERLGKRGLNRRAALERMRGQLSQRAYIDAADLLIHNDSTMTELRNRVRRIWRTRISCS